MWAPEKADWVRAPVLAPEHNYYTQADKPALPHSPPNTTGLDEEKGGTHLWSTYCIPGTVLRTLNTILFNPHNNSVGE